MTTKTTTAAENGVCTALANHGDGTFGKWCVERCQITRATALNYMRVTEVFGSQKQLNCKSLLQSFTAEALYYLSRDTTPEEATRDALKLAKKGERITLAVAKELAAKYTVGESDGGEEYDAGSDLSLGGRCNSSPYVRAREGRGHPLVRTSDWGVAGEGRAKGWTGAR